MGITNFTEKELACNCCGKVKLDPVFKKELEALRIEFNAPMKPTSVCRCAKHNKRVGGKERSFHISDKPAWEEMKGCGAIDVMYRSVVYRNELAKLAWKRGWRIGYNKTFLHLDIAAIKKILPKTIFKYDNVTDEELEQFKQIVRG